MTDTKLDTRSLTSEERAIVDAFVLRYLDACLPLTDAQLFQRAAHLSVEMIVARRKFFGEPASDPAGVECPNCGEMASENHEVVQSDGLEGGRRLFFYTCQQRISELDDRHNRMASPEYQAKVKADMSRRAVEIGVDRLVGITAFPVGNCPTCGELVAPWNKHAKYEGGYSCEPAQSEPVAAVDEEPNGWLALWQSASDGSWYACKRLVSSETEALDAARYEAGKDTPVRAFKFRGVPAPDREALRPVLDALRLGSISTRKASELARQWALGEELDSFTPAPDEPVEVMTGEEPVAEEMPEAVRGAVGTLREFSRNLAMRDGFYSARDSRVAREAADALESFWRTHAAQVAFDLRTMTAKYDNERVLRERDASIHAAQPAKVRMTEELEAVLNFAQGSIDMLPDESWEASHFPKIQGAIHEVRAQAAEAGKVRMPKVREALADSRSLCRYLSDQPPYGTDVHRVIHKVDAALAELDAAEGRK